MARWGLEVFDEGGNIVVDEERLLHRVWHQAVYDTEGVKLYPQPLDHEPTVLALALTAALHPNPMTWKHVTDGGQWIGLELIATETPANETLIVVFARR